MKILIALLAALVLVPAASAAYPAPYATQTLDKTLPSLDGSIQYAAGKSGGGTLIVANRTEGGTTVMSTTIPGAFGIPVLTQSGLAGGLFHDGSAFVLQQAGFDNASSHFAIVGTNDLKLRQTITLKGTFGFDALSPNGSMLYLIQHRTANDWNHYVVRAYNLRTHT